MDLVSTLFKITGSCQTCGYPRVTFYYGPAVPSKKPWKMSGYRGGSPLPRWATLGRAGLSTEVQGFWEPPAECADGGLEVEYLVGWGTEVLGEEIFWSNYSLSLDQILEESSFHLKFI